MTRILRLDHGTWQWLESEASVTGAALITVSAYVLLAFDRFGWPDFALRPTTRLVLTGVYGWMGLALASWAVARLSRDGSGAASSFIRLTGHAHVPLLLVALAVQVASVMLGFATIARWLVLFVGVFWMPAMLVRSVAASSGLGIRRALLPAVLVYSAWVAVVGRHLWHQLGHLL